MKAAKIKALEAAGWQIGDAADFLEMSEEEREKFNEIGVGDTYLRSRMDVVKKKAGCE